MSTKTSRDEREWEERGFYYGPSEKSMASLISKSITAILGGTIQLKRGNLLENSGKFGEDSVNKSGTKEGRQVLMAMSGGVDSSVAAYALGQDGYDIVGATMCLLDSEIDHSASAQVAEYDSGLEQLESSDIADAKDCAIRLGIPHHVFDFRDPFSEDVIDRFCKGYFDGSTPNPCIDCNRFIKFGALAEKRDELGLDYLATGHYARREYDPDREKYVLKKGLDEAKDQSYVLAFLPQQELARVLLPLGSLSKQDVRDIAAKLGFLNANKEESQDICFVQSGKYAEFIESHSGRSSEPGPILDEAGNRIGDHEGLLRYTVGQRKGLGIAAPYPLFVVKKDAASNALVVGPKESLATNVVTAHDCNTVTYDIDDIAGKCISGSAKTHYRHKGANCNAVFGKDGSLEIEFDSPIVKPASGQTLVVYEGDEVVGAGIID